MNKHLPLNHLYKITYENWGNWPEELADKICGQEARSGVYILAHNEAQALEMAIALNDWVEGYPLEAKEIDMQTPQVLD